MTPGFRNGRVACLGLVDEGTSSAFLIDATPNIAEQLWDLQQQSGSSKGLGLGGILLTHAHMGHYIGLLQLGKEGADARGVPVYCTTRMSEFLRSNLPWKLLVERGNISLRIISPNVEFTLSTNISVTAVAVPHRGEISDMVAFVIAVGASRRQKLLYCPDTDTWEGWEASITELCNSLEVVILDGTFYSREELPGRSIEEIPHPLVPDTVRRLGACRARLIFTHLNHSNPLLTAGSPERAELQKSGAVVAHVGMAWEWQCGEGEEPVGADGGVSKPSPLAAAENSRSNGIDPVGAAAAAGANNGVRANGAGGTGNNASGIGAASAAAAAAPKANDGPEVVDWKAAVEQCSGDETFLMELLMDLWMEGSEHMAELAITVPAGEAEVSGRIGHSIKGAAANLMCMPLREAAYAMEKVGTAAANRQLEGAELQQALAISLQRLQHEMHRFADFLRARGMDP